MEATQEKSVIQSAAGRVKWHRTPLSKGTLAELNAKSDLKGFSQSLGLLALTGESYSMVRRTTGTG